MLEVQEAEVASDDRYATEARVARAGLDLKSWNEPQKTEWPFLKWPRKATGCIDL